LAVGVSYSAGGIVVWLLPQGGGPDRNKVIQGGRRVLLLKKRADSGVDDSEFIKRDVMCLVELSISSGGEPGITQRWAIGLS